MLYTVYKNGGIREIKGKVGARELSFLLMIQFYLGADPEGVGVSEVRNVLLQTFQGLFRNIYYLDDIQYVESMDILDFYTQYIINIEK